jgi:hypothetical protein
MFIFSSNQVYYEHIRVVTYSLQKYLFNSVLHVPIEDDLTLTLRGFVVGSQISNLTLDFSFYCNSCISSVIEQCKGILGIYISKHFQWYHGGLIGCVFTFSTRALNIQNSHTSAIPKVGVHLEVIKFNFLHSPPLMKVCHSWTHFLGFMLPLHSTLNFKPDVQVVTLENAYLIHMPFFFFFYNSLSLFASIGSKTTQSISKVGVDLGSQW